MGERPGPRATDHVWRTEDNLNVSPYLRPCVPVSLVFLHCTQRTKLAHKFLGLLPSPPSICPGSTSVTGACCWAWLYVGSWGSTSDPQPCMASSLFLKSPLQPTTFHELIWRCNILGPPIASVISVFITVSRTWSHLPYFKSL